MRILEGLLNDPQLKVAGDEKCPGEKRMGAQSKEVQCLFGKLRLRRNYYYDAQRGRGRYPLDEALGLHNGYTPGVENVLAIRTALHSNRFDSYWDHKNAA
jgi:hypothetical protein